MSERAAGLDLGSISWEDIGSLVVWGRGSEDGMGSSDLEDWVTAGCSGCEQRSRRD